MSKTKITVIGSANIDLVTQIDSLPKIGETLLGNDFHHFLGGKGANQAVAAARLGGDVTFIGCVGDDDYGKQIKKNLKKEEVNTEHMFTSENTKSGIANIVVTKNDNAIMVIPGANYILNTEHIYSLKEVIAASEVVLLQLEIPIEAVKMAVSIAYEAGIPIVLNPAPAVELPKELFQKVTYITPNETEISILTAEKEIDKAFEKMYELGSQNVILTRGNKGVTSGDFEGKSLEHHAVFEVDVVDTTGAGDTFNAAFAISVAKGKSIYKAISYANCAAGLSTTKLGAQTGMPRFQEVEKLIINKKEEKI